MSTARAYFSEPGPALARTNTKPFFMCPTGAPELRSDPGPYPARGLPPSKARVVLKKCLCTQFNRKNLFYCMTIICCANNGLKFRSPASLTKSKAASMELLL